MTGRIPTEDEIKALEQNISSGDLLAVTTILQKWETSGLKVGEVIDATGKNVVHWACKIQYKRAGRLSKHQHWPVQIVDELLSRGCSGNQRDSLNQTPLFFAARYGHAEVCELLVEKCKCDANGQDVNGQTPLFYSVHYNQFDTTKVLLRLGADINI